MAGKIKNIAGMRFGRLIAVSVDKEKSSYGKTYWICKCDCGGQKSVYVSNLLRGATRSCGCLHLEVAYLNGYKPKTHGLSKHRLYKIWCGIIDRCTNHNNPAYERYGGRGISMCKEWRNNFLSFYNWAIKNGYDKNLAIDRIDNNGNYEPDNCRWATPKEQANNTRANIRIEWNGINHTLTEWSEITGIKANTIRKRIFELGWSVEHALSIKKRINKEEAEKALEGSE